MLLSDKYCTFSVRIVCSSRSVITETNTSLRATCNTARRFSHAPVCPRLGHPPPSCSATPATAWLVYLRRMSAHCSIDNCFRNYTGYASRSASSSGCVFWHITVCMAQHQRIWQTACGRHQMSSLVVVFLLSTARRC